MKGIYLEKNKNIEFFIGSFHDETDFVVFDGTTGISESAFENCDKLKTVIFGKLEGNDVFKDCYGHETSILKNVVCASVTDDFTIHTNAFKGCSQLTTLILPKLEGELKQGKPELIIKDNAFLCCKSLRTVVAVCDHATFTGNPFSCCPAHLTFVCKKDSDVDKFALRNNYRRVHVD